MKQPLTLIILDGWGHTTERNNNPIQLAHTPTMDTLWSSCPHALLDASGLAVGLPDGQIGNSEVGHLHLGAGRQVPQSLLRLTKAIDADGCFHAIAALDHLITQVQANQGTLHVIGLLSPGGVHSHETHLHAMLRTVASKGLTRCVTHAILDGRDVPPRSAHESLKAYTDLTDALGLGPIATLCGRYTAMDRDQRWERTQAAYDLMTGQQAAHTAPDALTALHAAYDRDESDEFVAPTRIDIDAPTDTHTHIQPGDAVLFMNFRADRARQLFAALTEPDFNHFPRAVVVPTKCAASLMPYDTQFSAPALFDKAPVTGTVGEAVATHGGRQLRIAETEKYAHVTYFFNGGRETPYTGEDRELVPSPSVATYDLQPEMSAKPLTDKLTTAIRSRAYDLIVCNYANPDMVGHTGHAAAATTAVAVVDDCLADVVAATQQAGGHLIITADHGNVECMVDDANQQAHTAHTTNPVPFIYYTPIRKDTSGTPRPNQCTKAAGQLIDIAPTLCALLNLPVPNDMTGDNLLTVTDE